MKSHFFLFYYFHKCNWIFIKHIFTVRLQSIFPYSHIHHHQGFYTIIFYFLKAHPFRLWYYCFFQYNQKEHIAAPPCFHLLSNQSDSKTKTSFLLVLNFGYSWIYTAISICVQINFVSVIFLYSPNTTCVF